MLRKAAASLATTKIRRPRTKTTTTTSTPVIKNATTTDFRREFHPPASSSSSTTCLLLDSHTVITPVTITQQQQQKRTKPIMFRHYNNSNNNNRNLTTIHRCTSTFVQTIIHNSAPTIMRRRHQLLFLIPMVIMFFFLTHLNQLELVMRLKSKKGRYRQLKQRLITRQQLVAASLRETNITLLIQQEDNANATANANANANEADEDWRMEYLRAKDAALPFQLPTPFTVRGYYNNVHKSHQKHSSQNNNNGHDHHDGQGMPAWLWDYVEFHNQHVYWNDQRQVHALREGTHYLKYSWCRHQRQQQHDDQYSNSQQEDAVAAAAGSSTTSWTQRLLQRLWWWQGDNNGQQQSAIRTTSTCRSEQDLLWEIDGLLTALYVAMMTHRVLVIEDQDQTPLQNLLDPNLIQWNIQDYPSSSLTTASTNDDNNNDDNDDDDNVHAARSNRPRIIPAHTTSEVQYVQDLCLHTISVQGIELVTKQWLGESHLWKSRCMHEYWNNNNSSSKKRAARDNGNDDDTTSSSIKALDRRHLYRWGFWTLFRMNDDNVLAQADRMRIDAGMTVSSSIIMSNTNNYYVSPPTINADDKDNQNVPYLRQQQYPSYQPYYYGLPATTIQTQTPKLQVWSFNNSGNNNDIVSSPEQVENDPLVTQCAQNFFQRSLQLATHIKEDDYDDDDDAIDDAIKKKYYATNAATAADDGQGKSTSSRSILGRTLLLASPPAQSSSISSALGESAIRQQQQQQLHEEHQPRRASLAAEEEPSGILSSSPILPIRTLSPMPALLSSPSLLRRSNTNTGQRMNDPAASLVSPWYTNVWAELVVAIEAECIIIHSNNNDQRKHSHDDSDNMNNNKLSGILAPRLSLSHPDTMKRCQISTLDSCVQEDDPHHALLLSQVLATLPWTSEASSISIPEEE